MKGTLKDPQSVAEAIDVVAEVIWLDRDIINQADHLSHGMGLASMDALILASLLSRDVREIYTTDSDFEVYHSERVSIVNLRSAV